MEHKNIPSAECHEPKHFGDATGADAGKVLTPSAVAGQSILRNLVASEVGALPVTGGNVSGPLNTTTGYSVAGIAVIGTQKAAVASLTDSTAGTPAATLSALPDPADAPASADTLRDDIVANLLPAVRNNYASLNAKLDSILVALRSHGLIAT